MTAIDPPTRADIEAAALAIRPYVRETPVLRADASDFGLAPAPLAFKLEFTQHSGTFKARGAFASLLAAEPGRPIVAASGGNHGAAVAYAAHKLGRAARIFVPTISNAAKIDRIRSYGAELVVGGDTYVDALAASRAWAAESGALEVHAFDAFHTLAGQGTTALEFARQAPDMTACLVAVGGGGLIGGMAAYLRGDIPLVAIEPQSAPTLERALAAGEPVDVPVSGLAADSLGARRLGSLAFPLCRQFVEQAVLVTDDEVRSAQLALWNVLHVVVEPGGAAAFAALLAGRWQPSPKGATGILLCGANTSAVAFG